MRIIIPVLFLLACLPALAQEQALTPEQREKQLYENIQKQVDDMADRLDLEDWQVFYADSILTANFGELAREYEQLGRNRVSDEDIYIRIQDGCMEKNYNAFRRILSDEQWAKYLKSGAAREKKARDKRAAKREKKS